MFTACQSAEQSASKSYDNVNMTVQKDVKSISNKKTQVGKTDISPTIADNAALYNRQIIKFADCKMQVEDIEQSTRNIRDAVALYGGFVGTMDLSNAPQQILNKIVLRVPNQNFEQLYDALQKEAVKIDYNRISTNDVTEQFVDIESRLKTKKAVQKRYDEILRKKATNIEQILETEEKLRKIQEEIDAKEGRLQYLSSQVSLSTLTITLYQVIAQDEVAALAFQGPSFTDSFKDNFLLGFGMVKEIFLGLVTIWPLLLIVSLIIFWKRNWLRKKIRVAQ